MVTALGVAVAATAIAGDTSRETGSVLMSASVDPVRLARVFWALNSSFTVPVVPGTNAMVATLTGEVLEKGCPAFWVIMANRTT